MTWNMFVLLSWLPISLIAAFFIVTNKKYGFWDMLNDWYNEMHSFRQALPRILFAIVTAPLYGFPLSWTIELIFK